MFGKLFVEYSLPEQIIRLWIDRKNKVLHISCLKTNYSKLRINWKYLFDEGKEAEQDKETENLTDEEFRKRMNEAMVEKVYKKLNRQENKFNPTGAMR